MVRKGLLPDVRNCNRILRMLQDKNLVRQARERQLDDAKDLIEKMLESCLVILAYTYNPLTCGYYANEEFDEALALADDMMRGGVFSHDIDL
ncbi:hypothetical protein IFM89_020317 [Coptis chinensis]|uniref:Uncharacterized protein n=1 Tax=Coptis chinensis TaxID=261450 RepID=A0A835LQV0_9MAGN|nr:hypothetical protein IFM89_020317 [Coptis chinensis]